MKDNRKILKIDYLAKHPDLILPVAELGHAEFGYLNPGEGLNHRLDKLQSHLNIDKLPITFVAFYEDEFVGTASLRDIDIDNYAHVSPWLGSVIIVPEKRNQKLGTALVQAVMRKAKHLNINTCYLYTPNRESFYFKMGWKTIDKIIYHNVPGVVMQFIQT